MDLVCQLWNLIQFPDLMDCFFYAQVKTVLFNVMICARPESLELWPLKRGLISLQVKLFIKGELRCRW